MYRLRIIVDEIEGFCDLPVTVGDYFEVDGSRLIVPPGKHVCVWALHALMPFLTAKQRQSAEENDWVPTTSRIQCPDPNGKVIYKVMRIGVDDEPNQDIPKRMLVDREACAGCRRCELACSMRHVGSFSPHESRILVHKDEANGLDIPKVCRQCGTAKCVEACPSGALSRDPATRAVLVDTERCVRCGACVRVCPFGAMRMGPSGYPLTCDLCGGDPACVEACPTGALRYGRAGETFPEPKFKQPGKEPPSKELPSEAELKRQKGLHGERNQ